jgi:hypothetical protein
VSVKRKQGKENSNNINGVLIQNLKKGLLSPSKSGTFSIGHKVAPT